MALPQNVSLPPFFTLTRGMTVQIIALDTSFGDPIAGVILEAMALSVDQQDDGPPPSIVKLDPAFLPGSEQLV